MTAGAGPVDAAGPVGAGPLRFGPAAPDDPFPPDPVEAHHIVSSGDRFEVDTADIRATAGLLRDEAEELRGAATTLRALGSGANVWTVSGLGGRHPFFATPEQIDRDRRVAAQRAAAARAADRLDAVAGGVEDYATLLDRWAGDVERHEEQAAEDFEWPWWLRYNPVTAIPLAAHQTYEDVGHLWDVGRGLAAWWVPDRTLDPDGMGVAEAVDRGVDGLADLAEGRHWMYAAMPRSLWPLLLRVNGTVRREPGGMGLAQTLAPAVDALRAATGSPTGLVSRVDPAGVPGLWTSAAVGPLAGAGAVGLLAPHGRTSLGPPPLLPGAGVATGLLAPRAVPPPAVGGGHVLTEGRPRSVRDLIDRVQPIYEHSSATNTTHVEVLRTDHADGTASFVVVVPGTNADAAIVDPTNVMDNGSNIELAAGRTPAIVDGITEALELAGAVAGDAVATLSHSQGGLATTAWMASDVARRFDVRGSVTLGAPIGNVAAPVAGNHVAIETRDDLVVGLDGHAGAHIDGDGATLTTYQVDTITSPERTADFTSGQAHYVDHNAAAWDAVAEIRGDDRDVAAIQEHVAELLGADEDGAVTTSVIVELERG